MNFNSQHPCTKLYQWIVFSQLVPFLTGARQLRQQPLLFALETDPTMTVTFFRLSRLVSIERVRFLFFSGGAGEL